MSGVVRLPEELLKFLDLPGPQTLLVRGPPGSGKTTLSLALLEAFHGDKFLVTSRVPNREINREFPWLGNNGSRHIEVVDTSEMEESVHDIARVINQAREYLLLPEPTREDREFAKFLWLPPPLQDTWARLRPPTPALIVIDSWDALVEQFLADEGHSEGPVPDRDQIERLLIRRMSRTPAHLVFIRERDDQTALDYLVNAVVVTDRTSKNDRLERWMTLMKLRGVRIENPVYPYTLESGRFESILPLRPYAELRSGPPDPEPDAMPSHIWPGARVFADNFGRLAFGKTTLLEMDTEVSGRVADVIVLPMVAHVLRQGGRVVMLPLSSQTPRDCYEMLNGAVPKERFLSHCRFVLAPGPIPPSSTEMWETVLPVARASERPTPATLLESEAIRFLREGASARTPGLLVVSVSGFISFVSSLGMRVTTETAARVAEAYQPAIRDVPVHAVIVAREEPELVAPLRVTAAVRVAVGIRQGRVFLHGIVPWTPSFVLTEGSETSPYELLRVV